MSSASQDQGASGSELGVFYVVALGLILFAILFYLFNTAIVDALFSIKLFELKLITLIDNRYSVLIKWIDQVDVNHVTLEDLKYIALDVGLAIRWPCFILSVVLSVLLYLRHPQAKFKQKHSRASIQQHMKNQYAHLKVIEDVNISKMDLDKSQWSMAIAPRAYVAQYKLLDPVTGNFNTHKAYNLMNSQLGECWDGFDRLSCEQKIIYVALCCIINDKPKESEKLLSLACQFYASKPSIKKKQLMTCLQDLSQFVYTDAVIATVNRHAYLPTVFIGLYQHAKTKGVISCSAFLWLKQKDRLLWYALNNVGRKAVFVEAAAANTHAYYETKVNHAIHYPMIESCVESLQKVSEELKELEGFNR
ncbi:MULTISPECIES: hypothetical protein [Cysteiniphilum]|uniref:secretion/conjugation apparatus DotM-related subunit n=1 Tax=Cysteiniphilum TaxID=2056696 RepID=UPI00178320B7|nr:MULTISPECIES: hypothetical protein [Cysteiniphilum]